MTLGGGEQEQQRGEVESQKLKERLVKKGLTPSPWEARPEGDRSLAVLPSAVSDVGFSR